MKPTITLTTTALLATIAFTVAPAVAAPDVRNARVERYFVEVPPETERAWLRFGDLQLRLQCWRVNVDPPIRNAAILVTSTVNGFFVAAPGDVPPDNGEREPGELSIVQHADIDLRAGPVYLTPQRGTQSNSIRGAAGETVLISGFIGGDLAGPESGCTFVGTLVRFRAP